MNITSEIIIVDPDLKHRNSCVSALTRALVPVSSMERADQLFDALHRGMPPAALLLAVDLGLETIAHLLREYRSALHYPPHQPLPVILYTVDSNTDARDILDSCGASFLLRRPFANRLLIDTVCSALRLRDQAAAAHFELDDAPVSVLPAEDASDFMRAVIDSIGIGVITVRTSGEVIFANRAAILMLGIETNYTIGIPLRQLFGDEASNRILHAKLTHYLLARELSIDTPRGPMTVECSLNELRKPDGMVDGITIIFRDLTQLHRLEEAVHMFSRSILDSLYSGVMTVDSHGRLEFLNRAACEVFSVSGDMVVGAPLGILVGEKAAQEMLEKSSEDKPWQTYELVCDVNYNRVQIGYSVSIRTNRLGQQVGTVIHFRDISLIKHLQDERIRHEQLVSMEVLVSALAHDIRNPLTSISAMAQLAKLKLPEGHPAEDQLKRIVTQVQRLNRLFQSFFAAIRVSREKPELVEIEQVMQLATELLSSKFQARQIELSFYSEVPQAKAYANPDQLLQILLNLLVFKINNVNSNGTIGVEVYPLDTAILNPPEEHFRMEAIRHSYIGGGTVVRMSDTGPIPPKEILNRLFDPFFRAEAGGSD
ncbi:MAG: PAS domain-containing protein, partial [bacterium]|nr:PAS domain-containing protein [bacterium]